LHAWLPERLDAAADATLAEHVQAFIAAGGEPVSLASMSRAIASLPVTDPGQDLTPTGRRRRPGRPLKQRA
jgi:phosphoribosylcarboxyaminoimidazole (NCAIR) mutase